MASMLKELLNYLRLSLSEVGYASIVSEVGSTSVVGESLTIYLY
jgi:hypothetical protein